MFAKTHEDEIVIPAHSSREFTIKMGKEYFIPESGKYFINLIPYNLFLDNDHSAVTTYSFEVAQDGEAIAVVTRLQEKPIAKSHCEDLGTSTVCGHTSKQIPSLVEAESKLVSTLTSIVAQDSNTLPRNLHASYENIFCKGNNIGWSNIQLQYSVMLKHLEQGVTYVFNSPLCQPGYYGFVYPEDTQRDIFLCDLFNRAPTLPTDQKKFDTKLGVISHETSHEAIKTKDHYYGYKKCHKDAGVCATDITFTNADCVQFFTESAFIVLGQDNTASDEEL